MTEKEINIAIATHLGWTDISEDYCLGTRPNSKGEKYRREIIKRYRADLNAMREAESGLPDSMEQPYYETLHEVAGNLDFYKATAAQRAEAFLRVVGLWKEAE